MEIFFFSWAFLTYDFGKAGTAGGRLGGGVRAQPQQQRSYGAAPDPAQRGWGHLPSPPKAAGLSADFAGAKTGSRRQWQALPEATR